MYNKYPEETKRNGVAAIRAGITLGGNMQLTGIIQLHTGMFLLLMRKY